MRHFTEAGGLAKTDHWPQRYNKYNKIYFLTNMKFALSRTTLLRRGLHEVSREEKVSKQERAKPVTPRALTFIEETSCKLVLNT
jgi:hypothetical protein